MQQVLRNQCEVKCKTSCEAKWVWAKFSSWTANNNKPKFLKILPTIANQVFFPCQARSVHVCTKSESDGSRRSSCTSRHPDMSGAKRTGRKNKSGNKRKTNETQTKRKEEQLFLLSQWAICSPRSYRNIKYPKQTLPPTYSQLAVPRQVQFFVDKSGVQSKETISSELKHHVCKARLS